MTSEETLIADILSRLSQTDRAVLLYALYNGGFMQTTEDWMWRAKFVRVCEIRYTKFELTAWGRKLAYEHWKTLPITRRGER